MPVCKNNKNKTYIGNEPSPKGLGYCASGEKEGTQMKGKDGNMWKKVNGKWIKNENEIYKKILYKKLYNWWKKLANGNIIVIYKDKTYKTIKDHVMKKWKELYEGNDVNLTKVEPTKVEPTKVEPTKVEPTKVEAILWSSQSTDNITMFIDYLIKKKKTLNLDNLIKIKNLPIFLLDNYKKFFIKYEFVGKKDYTLKS